MKQTKAKFTTQKLCFIGLFGGLSTVLMLFKIPVFFALPFMKLDFAELPAILGGFMFGPLAGMCIVFVKIALNLMINGTDSMYVGEISNLLLSSVYVLTASGFYHRHKTKKRAAMGLVMAVIVTGGVALLTNTYLMFPAYMKIYGLGMEELVSMAGAVNPLVHNSLTMMLFSVFPFNVLKFGLVAVITFLIYKKLHLFILRLLN